MKPSSILSLLVLAAVLLVLFDRPATSPSPQILATEPAVATSTPLEPVPAQPSPDAALRNKALSAGLKPLPAGPGPVTGNALTPERIALGRQLFFEPRLSSSHLISCHTCHNLALGGDDNLPTSVGHGWQRGPRNAPTVYNAVYNTAQFWDGRAADLKAQAKGPIQAAVEMANAPEQAVATLRSMPEYVENFTSAFPDDQDPLSFDNLTKAIEAYEATLVTPNAPFDRWLQGEDDALNPLAKQGVARFVDKGCTACHNGVNVGGQAYFPFGLIRKPAERIRPPADKGRFAVTHTPSDEYVFRAAPLRNIALTAPYFHSGQVWSLEEAIAVMGSAQLGVDLTDADIAPIAAFLHSLTGVPPQIDYPMLPVEAATTPKPRL
ncbi:cytochrome-c peroxidase [Thiorhodovibrio frisius]|uniref:Cytochrome c peroxidase n=1 Tax=Thiorhodovibrio frisius TaxID=631362 RepID=H8YZ76_9GAMM|nr:cytochrome-c peroxidase [Thiorhodovibrio frisius]EIC22003.1 cytochrome c peroxidase [Thiorhodovibrio frisius]WPL24294.1 Cytochrome c551 peroxidase precursor [Thiorhodovibrio frisius]